MAKCPDPTAIVRGLPIGNGTELERLLPLVYDELRALAARHLLGERRDHTLQPTALVHEAYLKLTRQSKIEWRSRIQFFGAAGQAIRRILVDHARARKCRKRAGRRSAARLEDLPVATVCGQFDLVALDDALHKLHVEAPRKAQVVELRFFGGLTADETASILGVTTRSVERDWRYARAWLFRELSGKAPILGALDCDP